MESSPITRGLVGGVIAGLAAGSIVLAALAWQTSARDCEFPDTEECVFEQKMYSDITQLQALGSGGLALLAAGLYLFNRRG